MHEIAKTAMSYAVEHLSLPGQATAKLSNNVE